MPSDKRRKSSTDLLAKPLLLGLRSPSPCRIFNVSDLFGKPNTDRVPSGTPTATAANTLYSFSYQKQISLIEERVNEPSSVSSEDRSERKTEKRNSVSGLLLAQMQTTSLPANSGLKPPMERKRRASFNLSLFPSRSSLTDLSEEKVEQLTERLVHLSRLFLDLEPLEKDIFFMEQSWEEVVCNATNLSQAAQKHQAAIWELFTTEATFIQSMRTIQKVFLNTFQDVQPAFFSELQKSRIFSNLEEVLEANKILWKRYMHPCLRVSRLQGLPVRASLMRQGFLSISDIFRPYTKFCMEMSGCRRFIQNQERLNPCFAAFLQWGAGMQTSCRLSLCDQLVHPFQRLTKYKLLLERIRDYSTDSNEISDLDDMIRSVSDFVLQVNEDIHRHELWEKLEAIDHRLEGYDAVELPSEEYADLLRQFSDFRLKSPMMMGFRHIGLSSSTKSQFIRHVLHQGSLRLKEGLNKTIEVYCYLFTDLMLITKPSKKSSTKQKICKPPIRLDRLHFRKINDNSLALLVLNDFHCATAIYGITTEPRLVGEWLAALKKAQENYLHLMRECNALCAPPSIPYADEYELDRNSILLEENSEGNRSLGGSMSCVSSDSCFKQLVPTVQVIRSSPNIEESVNGYYMDNDSPIQTMKAGLGCDPHDVSATLRLISTRRSPVASMGGPQLHFCQHELSPPPQRPRSVTDLRSILSPNASNSAAIHSSSAQLSHIGPNTKESEKCLQSKSSFFVPLPSELTVDSPVPETSSNQDVLIESCTTEAGPRRSRSRTPRRNDPRFHTDPTPTTSPSQCSSKINEESSIFPNKRLSSAFSTVNTNCMSHSGEPDPRCSKINIRRRNHLSKEQRFSFDSSSGISSIGSGQAHSENEISDVNSATGPNVQVLIHHPPSLTSLEKLSCGHLELESPKLLIGSPNTVMRPQELSLPISGSPTVSASNLSQRSGLSQDDDDEGLLEHSLKLEKPRESVGTQTSPSHSYKSKSVSVTSSDSNQSKVFLVAADPTRRRTLRNSISLSNLTFTP